MTAGSGSESTGGEATGAAWPVELAGVVESVTTTPGPAGGWAVAALGLHAGDDHDSAGGEPVRARTWGRTRTRRGFEREGRGVVQFLRDPVVFVEAALGETGSDDPVLDGAAAWVAVEARELDAGSDGGTGWVDWSLAPVEGAVRRREVPVTGRAYPAVVEMTVAASRLGVPAFDDDELRARLRYFASVVRRCGGPRDRGALDRLESLSDWDPDEDGRVRWAPAGPAGVGPTTGGGEG